LLHGLVSVQCCQQFFGAGFIATFCGFNIQTDRQCILRYFKRILRVYLWPGNTIFLRTDNGISNAVIPSGAVFTRFKAGRRILYCVFSYFLGRSMSPAKVLITAKTVMSFSASKPFFASGGGADTILKVFEVYPFM
jgi:hypothetical protein